MKFPPPVFLVLVLISACSTGTIGAAQLGFDHASEGADVDAIATPGDGEGPTGDDLQTDEAPTAGDAYAGDLSPEGDTDRGSESDRPTRPTRGPSAPHRGP